MKYGVLAKTRSGSLWGAVESWCRDEDGKPLAYDTREQARDAADELNSRLGNINCFHQYFAAPMELEERPQQGMRMW